MSVDDAFPGDDRSVADVLLAVHRSYLSLLKPLLSNVHAMAHITGGGLPGNLEPRAAADARRGGRHESWQMPNVFVQLQRRAAWSTREMFRTFNMGVGMVVIAAESRVRRSARRARGARELHAWRLGVVTSGSGQVILT